MNHGWAASRCGVIVGIGVCMVMTLAGCRWQGERPRPSWIENILEAYPADRYVVGIGQSTTRAGAEEQAYVAVSRIFKSEVIAQSRDRESYTVRESHERAVDERRLELERNTQVSTSKVLESVRILDTWFDAKQRQYYALAGMEKAQADSILNERIRELDAVIAAEVDEARRTTEKRTRAKLLKRAVKHLQVRDAYNADLQIIRASGTGSPPAYRLADLTDELERFLAGNLTIGVIMEGDQAEPVRRALIEGLTHEGLSIASSADMGGDAPREGLRAELVVKGTVRLWPLHVGDPRFVYVRWCSDALITDASTGQVLGAVSKGGKEGHLAEREAMAKAVRVMQREFSTDLARVIAGYIYGELDVPSATGTPPGCPRAERHHTTEVSPS